MPDIPWHWNETNVDAISDLKNDPGALQKSIEFFFKKLDIKGIGPGNVARLIKAKIDTIPKILAAFFAAISLALIFFCKINFGNFLALSPSDMKTQ